MERLYEFFNRKLKSTPTDFLRYKYERIKWDGRAFGLVLSDQHTEQPEHEKVVF